MQLSDIISAFESANLATFIDQNGPDALSRCWTALIESRYDRKLELASALIAAGLDCDLRDATDGQTPVEQALARNDSDLVKAMLTAEAQLLENSQQRMVYRLVTRGNVRLLKVYFAMQRIEAPERYRLISYALEEVQVKWVPLRDEMAYFCHRVSLEVFYGSVDVTEPSVDQRREWILERLDVMVKEIEFLQSYGVESLNNFDNEFVLALQTVAENLFAVGQLWSNPGVAELGPRSWWSRLRPQKICFCVEMFVAILVKMKQYEVFVLFLDKQVILGLLTVLRKELICITRKDYCETESLEFYLERWVRQNDVRCKWDRRFPEIKLTRDLMRNAKQRNNTFLAKAGLNKKQRRYLHTLISKQKNLHQLQIRWNKKFPRHRLSEKAVNRAVAKVRATDSRVQPLHELSAKTRHSLAKLDRLYARMKNLHSVNRIATHIAQVKDIPLTKETARRFAYAAFRRVVQVFGECCKNTKQTPSLGGRFHLEMSRHHSRQVLGVFEHQRNSSTHELSLTEVGFRTRILNGEVDGALLVYCQTVQSTLKDSYRSVQFLQVYELIRGLRRYLGRILRLTSIEQCRSLCWMIKDDFSLNVDLGSLYDFERIISLLESLATNDEIVHLREDFRRIFEDVRSAKSSMMNHIEKLSNFTRNVCDYISSLHRHEDLNVVKRITRFYLSQGFDYYNHGRANELRQTNLRLVSIMKEFKFSDDTKKTFLSLNYLLLNRSNTAADFRHVQQNSQFVPSQNELYTDSLLNVLKIKHLTIPQFNAIHDALARKVYNPLHKTHRAGMFAVDAKFEIVKQLLKEHHIRYDSTLLPKAREEDRRHYQKLFERMLEELHEIAQGTSTEDALQGARVLATQYGLLEVCSMLSHTPAFQRTWGYLTTPAPLLTGRYLRNAISHDAILAGAVFHCSEETLRLTIEVLYGGRDKLLGNLGPNRQLPTFGEYLEKYERRKCYLQEQKLALDGGLDELLKGASSRLDIRGCYFCVWESGLSQRRNLLDMALYNYPDEAIAYIEAAVHGRDHFRPIFQYLWSRLRHCELIGRQLEPIMRVFSVGGTKLGFLYQDDPGVGIDDIAQHIGNQAGARVEDAGFEPREQIENILNYCLLVKRLNKFEYFYLRFGKQYEFTKLSNFFRMSSIPELVERLSAIIPWNATNSLGFNIMHMFCFHNNVQALQDALEVPQAIELCRAKVNGMTPLSMALSRGHFECARALLNWSESSALELMHPYLTIVAHQNDLLEYFIPELEANQFDTNPATINFSFNCSGNIEAFQYLKSKLSTTAFERLFDQSKYSLLSSLIDSKTNQQTIERFISYPEVHESINRSAGMTPLSVDVQNGRFKYTRYLLSKGAAVTFRVIRSSVEFNSYKQTSKLYKLLPRGLTDAELQELIKLIVMDGFDVKLLDFFIQKLTSPPQLTPYSEPYSMIYVAIVRHHFKHLEYLSRTLPTLLAESNHHMDQIVDTIFRWNSLATDKPFLLDFLNRHSSDIPAQPKLLLNALQLGDLDITRLLIEKGAPLNTQDEGFTPLALAALNCAANPYVPANREIFKLLLEHGADLRFLMLNKPRLVSNFRILTMIIEHTQFAPNSPEFAALMLFAAPMGSQMEDFLIQRYDFLREFVERKEAEAGFTERYEHYGPHLVPNQNIVAALFKEGLDLKNPFGM